MSCCYKVLHTVRIKRRLITTLSAYYLMFQQAFEITCLIRDRILFFTMRQESMHTFL